MRASTRTIAAALKRTRNDGHLDAAGSAADVRSRGTDADAAVGAASRSSFQRSSTFSSTRWKRSRPAKRSPRSGSIPTAAPTGGRVTVGTGDRKFEVDIDWLTGRSAHQSAGRMTMTRFPRICACRRVSARMAAIGPRLSNHRRRAGARLSPRRASAGFTLMEILVAFVVLATAVAVLYQTFSTGIRNVDAIAGYSEAIAIAEGKLTRAGPRAAGQRRRRVGADRGQALQMVDRASSPTRRPMRLPSRRTRSSTPISCFARRCQSPGTRRGRPRTVALSTVRIVEVAAVRAVRNDRGPIG